MIDPRYLLVYFDLPVKTSSERKAANRFRKSLKNHGFQMSQYSVYVCALPSPYAVETQLRRLKKNAPPNGSIECLDLTAKQYEDRNKFGEKKDNLNDIQSLISGLERVLML